MHSRCFRATTTRSSQDTGYLITGSESDICGEIMTTDAAIARGVAAGSRPFDSAADVDGDGRVTSLDVFMILQAAADAIEIC
ncbi:MAG: hypothetical protein KAU52_04590 [Methanosarcinales archaeon]|nr:hypothetical protein [Methanosarcinales archaeon]